MPPYRISLEADENGHNFYGSANKGFASFQYVEEIHGKSKEKDSILAADLLLKEIHSTNAEQRRCARDVLQNV